MTDAVPGRRYATRQHEVAYVVRLARAAGGVLADVDAAPVLCVQPEDAEHARVLIAATEPVSLFGAHLDGALGRQTVPLVALHAGAQNGRAKRWPTASWAALADLLIAQLGARVCFTGTAADASVVAAIRRCMRHERVAADLCGRTTLADLAALLDQCDLLISGDSGPLHIACAVGTPAVGLYGPTDPALSGPVSPDAIVLRQEIWCAPCYDASAAADCRFGNPVCMKALTPARVFAAARDQLARHGMVDAPLPVAIDEAIARPSDVSAPDTTPALRRRLP
jgi:lipopolysaccharide heptosyltransferase II